MELTGRLVREKAREYPDESPMSFEEEQANLEDLPFAFEEGSWCWDDLEWIIRWKSPRALSDFEENDVDEGKQVIEEVIREVSVLKKVEKLKEAIDGVHIPVASSILLFMNPTAYTVLDTYAWGKLHDAGFISTKEPSTWKSSHYLQYLGICHALAEELKVDLRTLDRALWVMGRE